MALKDARKQLCRSRNLYIGGVCAGIAEYYGLDALVVRILAILLALVTFGLIGIVYLVLWAHLPLQPAAMRPVEIEPQEALLFNHGTVDYYLMTNEAGEDEWVRLPIRGLSPAGRIAVLAVLLALFFALAFLLAPLVPGTAWWQFWPLLFLIVGMFLIVVPIRSRVASAWVGAGIMMTVAAAGLLSMSLDIVAWDSLAYAFELLWPLVVVAAILYISGVVRSMSALVLGGAFCFVLFCVVGVILCVLPGQIETLRIPFTIGLPGLPTV